MKQLINKLLIEYAGKRIVSDRMWNYHVERSQKVSSNAPEFIELISNSTIPAKTAIDAYKKSKSQILQDIFVLLQHNFKKNGFFVEFGSTDGKTLSNTHLLEKEFDWKGILVEPSKFFHKNLHSNRNCIIDERCVHNKSGSLVEFNDLNNELSTINMYSSSDGHKKNRVGGDIYQVETVSLVDLLDQYNSPKEIDYISIDTEGSELDILEAFDFDKYRFKVITVEHNYTDQRDKIKALLEKNGYTRVHESISKWDDWYIPS